MCVLAMLVAYNTGSPLIVAANRDEFYDRPAEEPQALEPGVVGGRDLRGGGTWLGINRRGLFVAITNRAAPERTPDSWSRGLLAREALRCRELG